MLIDAKAFRDQVDLFEKTFGDSVVVTVERAEKVAHLFDWNWATRFLDSQGRAEYERVNAPAWAAWLENKRVIAPAWAENKRVNAPAWAAWVEYKRVIALAWATAFIDMHKRGESK
jgi:hypothetical protein